MNRFIFLLLCLIFVSSIFLVNIRKKNRDFFSKEQNYEMLNRKLNEDLKILELERSNLMELHKIKSKAIEQGMIFPEIDQVMIIRE